MESAEKMKNVKKYPYKSDEMDTIEISSLFKVVWFRKWKIVAIAAVFSLVAGIFQSQIEPEYRATATVMFGVERANITNLQDLLTGPAVTADQLENEIQILSSKSLLMRVVTDLDLANDPEFNPVVAVQQEFVAVRDERGDIAASVSSNLFRTGIEALGLSRPPEATLSDEEIERWKLITAVDTLRESLSLQSVSGTTVIEISFTAYSPEIAAEIVNKVTSEYVVDQMQVRYEIANAATQWLATRVDELRVRVRSSEEAVENLRASLLRDTGQGLAVIEQQLVALNASLSSSRSEAANLEGRYQRLSEAVEAGVDLSSESELIRAYLAEERDLVSRRSSLSASHPAVPQIEVQIAALQERISAEATRILGAARNRGRDGEGPSPEAGAGGARIGRRSTGRVARRDPHTSARERSAIHSDNLRGSAGAT